MSYAEAKQIANLRLELRACWTKRDLLGAVVALARLTQCAGSDADLTAEIRRWAFKLNGAVDARASVAQPGLTDR